MTNGYKSSLLAIELLYKYIKLIREDKKHVYSLHVYTDYSPLYIISFSKYVKGMLNYINTITIAKKDFEDNKNKIESLDCYYLID